MIFELALFTFLTLLTLFIVGFFINKTVHQNAETRIDESAADFKQRIDNKIQQYEKIIFINTWSIWFIYSLYIVVSMWEFHVTSVVTVTAIVVVTIPLVFFIFILIRRQLWTG